MQSVTGMNAGLEVRPMDLRRDCDGVARVRSACFPAWPISGDEFAQAEARRIQGRLHSAWVGAVNGTVAAYGYVEEPSIAGRQGRIRIRVIVDPPCRRRGFGSALYAALHAQAVEAGADELVTETQAEDRAGPSFLARLGFVEYHQRIESRLAMAAVDPLAIAHGIERSTEHCLPSGIRIATYRQLSLACSDAPRRLYELDATLWADVPFGLTGTTPTFEQYQAMELDDPDFLAAATFIAVEGERWVGLCALSNGRGYLLNSVTGVLRDWRKRGLARWLKLHSIRWALEADAAEIRTFNDGVNDAILALNRSLGFERASVELRYRKAL